MKRRTTLTSAIIVIGFAIVLSFVLLNIGYVVMALRWLGSAAASLAWGAIAAFIINVPMSAIERLLTRLDRRKRLGRFKRALSLFITVCLLVGAVYLVLTLVLPELYRTLLTILDMVPAIVRRIDNFIKQYDIDVLDMLLQSLGEPASSADIQRQLSQTLDLVISGVSFSTGVVAQAATGVMDTFFSVLFALYILASKERLNEQARELLYAFVSEPRADRVVSICRLAHDTYSSFIAGQCTEALILGVMFFVFMTLFRMPYALLISVFITVTAVVPLVGAWLGCIVGALLILINDPMTALWFVLMFLLLQQIEGNLIYPHVVGNSIGLKPIWTLAAVVLGQGMFGIVGMLLFIPLASVLYTLLRHEVHERLHQRDVPRDKLT
ncbi:MAG TPA: AI-2E family transporter [Candidatus Fimadaptatus faecigallinarum]|uniref:AI-2E family transporter n=1 Tax=Candidatus Fimadaptatus faecigallinarum TaxID=2840814 RepID=A0A9D1LSC0_9FIRM|nr:AI-2E family transporter [Candidatus Fimadaptatus faecigallinarum]